MSLRLAVAMVVFSGCVTTTGSGTVVREQLTFAAPPAELPGWKRIVTKEFELVTDLEPALAQRAASLISQSLTGLNAMFARAPVKGQLTVKVIAMADGLDFERRFGKRVGGFAASNATSVTLLLYGPPDKWFEREEVTYDGTQSVVNHELGHAVLRRYFPVQPRWFAEGMAEYLETFRWLDAETVRLGDPNLSAYRTYRAIRSLSVKDLVAWETMNTQRDREVAGHYGLAWAFVHYLRNREAKSLGQYMAVLANGDDEAAWAVFAGREEELDKAIYGYMKQGDYSQFTIKVAPSPKEDVQLVPLSESERGDLMKDLEELAKRLAAS